MLEIAYNHGDLTESIREMMKSETSLTLGGSKCS